jgi:UDP-N-acetylmuramate dehydrogenase
MKILTDIPLAPYTTFKVGGPARFFCAVESEADLVQAVKFAREKGLPAFILGGGSNVFISDQGFSGLVIHMAMKGIAYDGGAGGRVSAAAGEDWDAFVGDTVSRGLSGLENLSAIPGSVGAAPVQNIGAYGGEAARTIVSVRALDTKTLEYTDLSNADCHFSYRDSLFKHEKGRYVIVRV